MPQSSEAFDPLVNAWQAAGLADGDVVLAHTDLKRIFRHYLRKKVRLSAETVLDTLLAAVGERGTVLLPLFNFSFTSGTPFDIRTSPSKMGAVTESGRLHPEAVRTGHPIYSFAAIGRQADLFRSVDNFSGYGADSPFGMLKELDGKIAVMGLSEGNSMTFYHHIEECREVDYRFHKRFTGRYTGWDGQSGERTYGLFVRDLERGVKTHVDPMGELLWAGGLYSGERHDEGHGIRVISARAMFGAVGEVIDQGRAEGLLYRIET